MDLRKFDLNLLVAFDILLEERSVTKAADRLFVGQSAMSATLARLRALLDDPILVRQGRRMVPTPQAEALAGPIREILDLTSATLSRRTAFDPGTDHRTISIGASDYVTFVFLRHLLRSLSVEAPNVRLNLRPIGDRFIDDLRSHRVDLMITAMEAIEDPDEFHHERLFKDRYVCVVDADNSQVGATLSHEQFMSIPYVATNIGREPSIGERELDSLGLHRNIEITTTFLLSCFLVEGTGMMTMAHERLAREFAKDLNLRIIDPPVEMRGITELMLWTARYEEDPAHKWLRGRISDLAKEKFA